MSIFVELYNIRKELQEKRELVESLITKCKTKCSSDDRKWIDKYNNDIESLITRSQVLNNISQKYGFNN